MLIIRKNDNIVNTCNLFGFVLRCKSRAIRRKKWKAKLKKNLLLKQLPDMKSINNIRLSNKIYFLKRRLRKRRFSQRKNRLEITTTKNKNNLWRAKKSRIRRTTSIINNLRLRNHKRKIYLPKTYSSKKKYFSYKKRVLKP